MQNVVFHIFTQSCVFLDLAGILKYPFENASVKLLMQFEELLEISWSSRAKYTAKIIWRWI